MLDTCEESIFYEIYCSSLLWKALFAVALRATCRSPHGAEEGQEKRGEEKKIPKVEAGGRSAGYFQLQLLYVQFEKKEATTDRKEPSPPP